MAGIGIDFGLTIASVDSARIKFTSLKMENYFGSISEIINRVYKHFSKQIYMQFVKLFGSIDILGNPAVLIENVVESGKGMFWVPIKTLVKSGKI